MIKKPIMLSLIFILLLVTIALAETTIKAEVDKTRITAEDNLTYKVIISSEDKNLPRPRMPNFENFYVLSQAESSTVSLVEASIKTVLVYAYILAPKEAGKFRIGPAAIKVKDKEYSTDIFEIEVVQAKTKERQKPALPQKSPPESEEPEITL